MSKVVPGGQGAAAGIAPGDVLIAYGDTPISSPRQLTVLAGQTRPEETLTLRWLHPGAGDASEGPTTKTARIHGGRIGVGQALAIHRAIGEREGEVGDLTNLGVLYYSLGRYSKALDHHTQALAIHRESGDGDRTSEGANLADPLLVHLDGRLRYVPFAALYDGRQWLAERWPIVYYTAASERRPESDSLSLHDLREHEPRLDLRHLDLVTLSACNTAMGGADNAGAEGGQ